MKTTNYGTRLLVEDSESLVTPLPGQAFIVGLLSAVNSAKFSLDIIQYQWVFYRDKPTSKMQELNRAILARARAGLKVRVLLNKEGRGGNLTAINLKAAEVLRGAGVDVRFGRSFPTTHAKLFVFDDDAVILGSHNLSNRSVTINNESSALIKSRAVAVEFKRYFDLIWGLSG